MTRFLPLAWLVLKALCELIRYDVMTAIGGFAWVRRQLAVSAVRRPRRAAPDARVCEAVRLATCLYWKPVLCLQRSVCATRLLRQQGVAARLVIGYRPVPFFSHAWVEVAGRVVDDSPAYQRLHVLYTA